MSPIRYPHCTVYTKPFGLLIFAIVKLRVFCKRHHGSFKRKRNYSWLFE